MTDDNSFDSSDVVTKEELERDYSVLELSDMVMNLQNEKEALRLKYEKTKENADCWYEGCSAWDLWHEFHEDEGKVVEELHKTKQLYFDADDKVRELTAEVEKLRKADEVCEAANAFALGNGGVDTLIVALNKWNNRTFKCDQDGCPVCGGKDGN